MTTTTTTATQVAAAYQVILQASPPGGATGAYATSVAAQIDGGYLTLSDYESSLLNLDQTLYTTTAALVTIDAFYNATPSQATLATAATATSGTTYDTALELHNLGYSDANVWTILGADWGADPNSSFYKLYSGLADGSTNSYTTFIDEVYTRVFGSGPTAANLQNLLNDIPGLTALLSGGGNTASTLQVMGGLFGYLLYAGQSSGTGAYASAANAFLTTAANDEVASPGSSAALFGPPLAISPGVPGGVIDAATIASANSILGSSGDVVITPASGAVTVTIENTAGLISENGIVIQGNANITVNDVDGGIGNTSDLGQIVTISGTGNNTINLNVGVTDSVTGGSGSTNIVLNNGFKMSGSDLYYDDGNYSYSSNYFHGPQTFEGGTGASNTITVLGTADLTAGIIHNIQTIDLASGAVATFSAGELAGDLTQPVPAVTPPLEPSIIVASGGSGSLIITDGGSVNLTGKLSGVTSLTVEDGSVVTLGTADIAALTSVSTQPQSAANQPKGEIITTVAGAETLLALDPNLNFGLSDTPADLLAAPASVLAAAQSVAGTVTIAQAVALHKAAPNATYTVSDTPTDIQDALVFNDDYGALVTAEASELYTAPATVAQAELFAVDLQNGNGISIADTAANVGAALESNALPAFNTSLTGNTPNGVYGIAISGTATAAEANAIASFVATSSVNLGFVSFSGTFSIADSIADLENVSSAAATLATSVSILPGAGAVSVATISAAEAAVAKGGKTLSGTYSLDDSASDLVAAPGILRGASSVTVTDGTIGVAVAAQIVDYATPGATVKFQTLSDTAADLTAAPLAVLQDATTVQVTSTANVAQSAYLAQYVAPNTIALVDNGADLAGASAAVLTNAKSITITGTVTAAQAMAIYNELTALNLAVPTYSITDSAADLIAIVTAKGYAGSAAQTVLDDATKVTVSDATITVAQAQELYSAGITHLGQYNISDTVANVVAAAGNPDVTIGAATVAATGPATVQQALTLTGLGSEFVGGYSIVDTPANIIQALAGNLALLNGSTSPVTFSGSYPTVVTVGGVPTVTVNQATALETSGLTNWSGTYVLADSIANLMAASTQDTTAANGNVYALDSVTDLNNGANLLWVKANTKGYIVQDSFADVNGNQAIGAGAVEVVITDPALSAANSETLSTINPNSLFDLADTAGNLTVAALVADAAGIKLASEVTVTGGMTVANATTLLGLNANTTFSLLDTGADLVASGAAATVGLAAAVSVSGGATVNQAAAIVAAATLADTNNSVVYSLTDTTADIQAAITATVDGASSVTVTDGNRVTLNVAEVTNFNTLPSTTLNGWTSSAAGDVGAPVTYNLTDTMADLATALGLGAVQDAGTVTASGGAAVTVAQVAAVEAAAVQPVSASYTLDDGIGALLAASAITNGASAVTVTGQITVAQAALLLKLTTAVTYTLDDTAAALTTSIAAAEVSAATQVIISGSATVAQVQALEALNPSVTYSLDDTAANLAAASASLLKAAGSIIFTTSPTVAQITAIDKALGTDIYVPTGIVDTAANIAAAPQLLLNNANSVTVTGTATAAQGALLENLTYNFGNPITFTVTDTAANIAAADVSFDDATSVKATGTATAAQAAILNTLVYNGGGSHVQYAVSDSAANLLSSTSGWASSANVSSVTVTDASVNIATAEQLYAVNSGLAAAGDVAYVISDTQDRIVEALGQFGQAPTGIDLNAVLGHAASVSIGGTTAVPLMSLGGTYVVDGSIATLGGLSSAVLAAAGVGANTGGYVVVDTIANEQANLTTTAGGYFGDYVIADTTADITAAAPSFVVEAKQVRITDPATTYADVEAVRAMNSYKGLTDVTYSLTDTAAALFNGSILNSDADQATSITVTNAVTVADADSLLANHPTKDTYSISDTEFELFNGSSTVLSGDVNAVKAASSVTITGSVALTDAQAASLVGDNSNATYSIADSPATLFTTVNGVLTLKAEVSSAATVSVNGANLTVAQAALLTGLGTKFVGGYNLVDSSADLAGASGTVLQGASTIVQNDLGTGGATIAQAAAIVAGLGSSTKLPVNFTVTDTVANIAGARQSLLTDIKFLSVSTGSTAFAAQAEQLAGLTYGSAKSAIVYDVKDTSANILSGSNAAGIVAAAVVTATDQISVATAGQIYALNSNDQFSLKDVSTAFGISPVVQDATAVEVTDAVNVGEATVLQGDFSVGTAYTFDTVSDTYANLSAPANQSLVDHATVIDVTGATSVANVETLEADYGAKVNLSSVQLSDTAGATVNAYYDANNAPIVADAASITVTSSASVAQAQILEGLHIATNTTFGINDTLQFISQAYQTAPGVLNSADVSGITVTANENDSGVATSFTDIGLKNVDVVFSHGGSGSGETIGLSGSAYSLLGVDLLNLNAADTLDLNGYGITAPGTETTSATLPGAGSSTLIQGQISNNGANFTASATGSNALLLWNSGGTTSGVLLVSAIPHISVA